MTEHTFTVWHVIWEASDGRIYRSGTYDDEPTKNQLTPWSPGFRLVAVKPQTFTVFDGEGLE